MASSGMRKYSPDAPAESVCADCGDESTKWASGKYIFGSKPFFYPDAVGL